MFLTKPLCPLLLLMSLCVGLSRGGITLYDLMQNSDDDCFDKSGDIYKGKSCYKLVEESSGYCYTSIEEFCCLSCSFQKRDVSGCEYGDKSFKCDAKLCGKYDQETRENICCRTCDGVTSEDLKPTTQKPVTSSWSGKKSKASTDITSAKKHKKPVKTFSFPVLKERKGKRKSSIKHHVKVQTEPEPIYSSKDTNSFDKTAGWIDPEPLPVVTDHVEPNVPTSVDKSPNQNYVISHWEDPSVPSTPQQKVDSVHDTVLRKGYITNSENKINTGKWIDPELPATIDPIERKNSPSLSAPGMSTINHLKDTVLSMPSVEVAPEIPTAPIAKDNSPFHGSSIAAGIPKPEGSGNGDLISPGFDIKPWDSYATANKEGGVVSGPTVSPVIPESNLEKKTVDLTNNPIKILKVPVPKQNNEYAGKESANIEPQIILPTEPVPLVIPIPPHVVQPELVTEAIDPDTPGPAALPILEPPHVDQSICGGTKCPDVPVAPEQNVPWEETAPVPDKVTIIQEPMKTEASPAVKNILANFINPNEPDASPNVEQNVLQIIPGPKSLGFSVTVDPLALPLDLETAIVEGISLRDAMIKIPKEALTVNDPIPFNEPSQSIPFFGQENSFHQNSEGSKIKKNIEILPMIEPSNNDIVIPIENTVTVKNVVPVENVLSVENLLPVENTLPVENILPIENIIPKEKVPVVDTTIPVSDVIPAVKVTKGPSSTIKEMIKPEKIHVKGSGNTEKTFLVKSITKPSSSVSSRFGVVPIATNNGMTVPPPRTIVIQRPMFLPYSPWFYHGDRNSQWRNQMASHVNTPVFVRKTRHFKIVRTPRKEQKISKKPKVTEPVQPIASWNSLHPAITPNSAHPPISPNSLYSPISPQPNMRLFSATPIKSRSIPNNIEIKQLPNAPIQPRKHAVQRQQSTINSRNFVSRHQPRPFHSSQMMQSQVYNNHQQRVAPRNSVIHQQQIPSRDNYNNYPQQMYRQLPRLYVHHLHSFNYPNTPNMQNWQNMNSQMQNYKSMNMNHLPFWYNGRW